MIGEVWICSGQSNLDFTMRGLGGWKNYKPEIRQEVADGVYSGVRMFTVKKDTSDVPLTDCKGNWITADTNSVNDFSATAWFYGAYLSKQLGVPVGLIVAAWGGTPAEVWTPVASIKENPNLGFYLNHFNGSEWWPGTPGVLFNSMISPLLNFTIKRAIWYQGESNCLDSRYYMELMQTLITSWRKAWDLGDFPFYYVQIAPFTYNEPFTAALLREAQLKCLSVPNTGMAVTLDLVDHINDIHPKNKLDVGKRLALWALNKAYGKTEVCFSGPVFSNQQNKGRNIILEFQHSESGLKLTDFKNNNFKIAGSDRVFYPATIKISGNRLLVSSSKVKEPQAVRYAFSNTAEATFFNNNGLPSPSFRTDNWDIITENILLNPFLDPQSKKLSYTLTTKAREADILYDFNKAPGKNSPHFSMPIPAGKSGKLFAIASRNGYPAETFQSWNMAANKASGCELHYKTPWSYEYSAGGNLALVDGILADNNFQNGCWQGFEGNDLEVIIDLSKTVQVNAVKCNFLSDNLNWIFLPKLVSVEVSSDGITYSKTQAKDISPGKEILGAALQKFSFPIKQNTRFIKLTALNQGVCPPGHPGAGNKCWLFADEIVIE